MVEISGIVDRLIASAEEKLPGRHKLTQLGLMASYLPAW